jgi:hypothetical protein
MALIGLHDPYEASEKKRFIEIWLGHSTVSFFLSFFYYPLMPPNSIKSSPCSSLQSAASNTSFSSAVRSGIDHGIKRIKKSADTLTRPLKRPKHALSNVSSSVVSVDDVTSTAATEDHAGEDWASTKTGESLDIIDVDLDRDVLKKELGMWASFFCVGLSFISFLAAAQKTWRSAVYSFFKPGVSVEIHQGRVSHFFRCSAKKCKTEARGVRCYQDKTDKSSTANLRHHAVRCHGEDCVNARMNGESGPSQSGNIFSSFALQGQQPVTYSHRAHTSLEFR